MKIFNLVFLIMFFLGTSHAYADKNYMGCFADDSNRAMPNILAWSGATVESCLALAKSQGYTYAGVQWYGQCFGSTNTVGYYRADDNECNTPCSSDPSDMCGGAWRNSVYVVNTLPIYEARNMESDRFELSYGYVSSPFFSHNGDNIVTSDNCSFQKVTDQFFPAGSSGSVSGKDEVHIILAFPKANSPRYPDGCHALVTLPDGSDNTGKLSFLTRAETYDLNADISATQFTSDNFAPTINLSHSDFSNSMIIWPFVYILKPDPNLPSGVIGGQIIASQNFRNWNWSFGTNTTIQPNFSSQLPDGKYTLVVVALGHAKAFDVQVGQPNPLINRQPNHYVGCFTDDPNRALPAVLSWGGATPESCIAMAKAAGFSFAGVQWYGQCFAGNAPGFVQTNESECNTPCSNDPSKKCGGAWRNSIYSTSN